MIPAPEILKDRKKGVSSLLFFNGRIGYHRQKYIILCYNSSSFILSFLFFLLRLDCAMSQNAAFLLHGLTQEHKDFLYSYAQKNLGSSSRTKAIIAIIDDLMLSEGRLDDKPKSRDDITQKAIQRKKDFIKKHQKDIAENNNAIRQAISNKNGELVSKLKKENQKISKVKKKRIQFSMPIYDYDFLKELAETNECSIQYYIKIIINNHLYNEKKLLGNELEALKKSNYELYRIGVNVNQIAKANNMGDRVDLPINKLYEFIKNHTLVIEEILRNNNGNY